MAMPYGVSFRARPGIQVSGMQRWIAEASVRNDSPSNSVARRLAAGGSKVRTSVVAVLADALRQGVQTVVLPLVVQFVQQFHTDDFTVAPLLAKGLRPFQAMRFQQHPPAVDVVGVQRGTNAQIGHTRYRVSARLRQRRAIQAMHLYGEDTAGGRLPVGKAQIHRLEAQLSPQLAAMDHVP